MKTNVYLGTWCGERLRDFKTEGLVVLGDGWMTPNLTCSEWIDRHCGERFAGGEFCGMYEGGDSGYKYVYLQLDGPHAEDWLRFMKAMHVKSVTVFHPGYHSNTSVLDCLGNGDVPRRLTAFSDVHVIGTVQNWWSQANGPEVLTERLQDIDLHFGEYGLLCTDDKTKVGYRLVSPDEIEIGFVHPTDENVSLEELEIPEGTQIVGLDGGYRVVGIASDAFESEAKQGLRRWTDDVRTLIIPRCVRSLDIPSLLKTFREIDNFQVDPKNPFFEGEGVMLRRRP